MVRVRKTQSFSTPSQSPTRHRAVDVESLETRTLFAVVTGDPSLKAQWALTDASVTDAWTVTRGSTAVIVADTDTGADYTHPDLYKNIWINQAEIPAAVRPTLRDTDSDGLITFYDLNAPANRSAVTDGNHNGYIDAGDLLQPTSKGGWEDGINGKLNANDVYTDDIVGWDFAEGDNKPFDESGRYSGHGTHTAGIIGAMGSNGTGMSGVAQKVSMAIVRIFGDNGAAASDAKIAQAIRYAADTGAKAINASWADTEGADGDTLFGAIQYAGTKGAVFVAAAGNDGLNIDSWRYQSFPAEYNLDNIISVGATTHLGGSAYWSDFGASRVDVAAPGDSIYSTLPNGRYGRLSGTSMAAPFVTGTIALMLSVNRNLSPTEIKVRLINSSDESTLLNNKSVSDGKLNVKNALANVAGVNIAHPPTKTTTVSSVASTVLQDSPSGSSTGSLYSSGVRKLLG